MKYCKKHGVLYSDILDVCPKCAAQALEEQESSPAPEAPKSVKVRQWIGICVGIPLMIFVLYAVIYWTQNIT